MQKDANSQEYRTTFYNQDMLQEMNDDRLDALRGMLKGKIISLQKESARKNEEQITHLQTEYAYVYREIEIRQNRKRIHEEYVRKIRGNRPQRPQRPGRPRRSGHHSSRRTQQ